MTTQKIKFAIVAGMFVSTTLFAPFAYAQGSGSSAHPNFFQGLIQFISQKFGLDQTQVQSAVKDYRAQQKATITPRSTMFPDQMQAMEKSRLDKLVTAGKITSAQETAILDEEQTLLAKYPVANLKNMTQDQRKTQMQNEQNDIKTWATAQGINPQYVMPGPGPGMMMGGMRGHAGSGGPRGWNHPSTTLTPAPTQ